MDLIAKEHLPGNCSWCLLDICLRKKKNLNYATTHQEPTAADMKNMTFVHNVVEKKFCQLDMNVTAVLYYISAKTNDQCCIKTMGFI